MASVPALRRRKQRAGGRPDTKLQIEQELLDVEPAAKAGQRTVRANHAVTGDDDRHGIGAIGRAHCAACRNRLADPPCDIAIIPTAF